MSTGPRILVTAESDEARVRSLVSKAKRFRERLRTDMRAGSISIASRKLFLDDEGSIHVKSVNGLDTIIIDAPAKKIPYAYTRYHVAYVLIDGYKGNKKVYFYDVKGLLKKEVKITLDEYYDEEDTLHNESFVGPEGIVDLDFLSWIEETNSVVIRVYPDWPYENQPESFYTNGCYYKRIPILKQKSEGGDITPLQWPGGINFWQPDTFFDSHWKNTSVEENYPPKSVYMTNSGFLLYAMIDHSNPNYSQSVGSSTFTGLPLYGEIGPQFKVIQAYDSVPTSMQYVPEDWEEEGVLCTCPSAYKTNYFFAVAVFDTSGFAYHDTEPPIWSGDRYHNEGVFKYAFIGSIPVWYFTQGSKTFVWRENYTADTGGVLSVMTQLVQLTKNEFYQLKRIECYNDQMYVFSDSGEGNRLIPGTTRDDYFSSWSDLTQTPKVKVYDLQGQFIREKSFSGKYFDPICLIEYPEHLMKPPYEPIFCFRTRTEKRSGRSEIQGYKVSNLERTRPSTIVNLPDKQTAIINIPQADYLVGKINELRSKHDKVWRNYESQHLPLPYVGVSSFVASIALAHLTWCLSEGALQHEDENGDLIDVWGPKRGVYACVDNIACIPVTGNPLIDLDTVLADWKASPHHYDNMTVFDTITAGWAIVLIPTGTKTFDMGPGAHLGGGSYSTSTTTMTLDSTKTYAMYQLIMAA